MTQKTSTGSGEEGPQEAAARRPNILVVEDHPLSQQLLRHMLEKLGLAATFVSDGEAAIKAVATEPYSMILMDVRMPGMNGLECARRLRQSGSPDLIIIAVTANAMAGDQQACLDAGMNDYLSKPITTASFSALMTRWLPAHISAPTPP